MIAALAAAATLAVERGAWVDWKLVDEPKCALQAGHEVVLAAFEYNDRVVALVCPLGPTVLQVRKDATAAELGAILAVVLADAPKGDWETATRDWLEENPAENDATAMVWVVRDYRDDEQLGAK